MNKIYKVIWSKTKQRYVVVSELAHSCMRNRGKNVGRNAIVSLTVLALTVGVGFLPALAANEDGTVLGNNTTIGENSDGAIAIGGSPTQDDENYVAAIVGDNSSDSIAVGINASIGNNSEDSIAIGHGATIKDGTTASIVMGANASASDGVNNVIAIGSNAYAGGVGGIAIGMGAGTAQDETGAIAIGVEAEAGSNSVSMGYNAKSTSNWSVSIGYNSESHSGYGAAIGRNTYIGNNSYGIAIGGYSKIGENAMKSIAIGASGGGWTEGKTEVQESASYSIAMGGSAVVSKNARYSIAMGRNATIGENATYSLAFGGYNTSIGDNATQSIALGTWAHIDESVKQGSASGYNAGVSANYGTAYGAFSAADAVGSTTLGYNSSVEAGADNSVAVGRGSKVSVDNILNDDEVETFLTGLGDNAYRAFNIEHGDTTGVFSIGSADGGARRMINVARGLISADSTDAINGSQLFGAVQYLDGRIDAVENKIAGGVGGGDVTIDGDTNIDVTETPDSATDPGTGGDTENPGTAGDNSQNFEVSMSDNPVFGGHETDEQGHSENGSVTVIGSNGANKIALNENNEGGMTVTSGGHTVNINKGGDGLVNGLTNTTWDWSKYEEGGYKGSDNAATESQLHGAVSGIKTEITNMGDQITNMGSQITNIGNKVGELDSRIDEVGAGAAALAALHPLDFDPDDKWDFAAGYGNYRGENAVAIGAFYRPNEDTMFSVGGTVGNDDNMVNAGVSFKIGQGNGVSTSRVAMAKEIKDLRKELEAMKSAMLDVNAGRRLDTSKLQLFPDVPQNHWAYEYVATLAGNGVIEGYPDGNFDGARPMTRYEFAAMLYRAMLNGAKLSDKILAEFAPELERFTVDVVHKDKDGNPTVERVRVVKRDDTAK